MWWILATVLLLWGVSWLGRRFLPENDERDDGAPDDFDDENDPDEEDDATTRALEAEPHEVEARHLGDELDLHGVPPRDVGDLVDAFVDDACARGLRRIRIIHGKGIGALRQQVRARLQRHPNVLRFGDAPPPSAWGATVAELQPSAGDVAGEPATD